MKYTAALARQLESQPTEDLQARLLDLVGRGGRKKTRRTRGVIRRILKEREKNGGAKIKSAIPDVDLKQAEPGTVVKTFPGSIKIVKGDENDWLYLKKAFIVKCPGEKPDVIREKFADSYETAVQLASGGGNKSESEPEQEDFDENDPYAPDADLRQAEPGAVVKRFPGGFRIIKGNKNDWLCLSDFIIECPGGRIDRIADSYIDALRIVRELEEFGEYINW